MSSTNERKTGRRLLEKVADSFSDIGFALVSDVKEPPRGAKSNLEYAVDRLKEVRGDVEKRLKEQPEWRDVENYFRRYPLHPSKDRRTLFQFMKDFETITSKSPAEKRELQALSGAIANRVLNMLGWIRDDAEKASEPFLVLLR